MINPQAQAYIVAARESDLGEMNRIEQEAFTTPWSEELLRGAIRNPQYTVRTLHSREARLLGFYIAHTVGDRSNLDNLAVAAWLRNRGHGSQMVEDWLELGSAERLEQMTLQVNTANTGAQRLYERFAFRTTRLLVAYYPNGDDAYEMRRDLAVTAPHAGTTQSRGASRP